MLEFAATGGGQFQRGVAGDTYNTACTLSLLGVDVAYVTSLGAQGSSAQCIKDHAASYAVSIMDQSVDQHLHPGLYTITNDARGERTFEYWRSHSAASALLKDGDRLVRALSDFRTAPYVYFSGISYALMSPAARQQLQPFLKAYRQQGGTVVFDSNYRQALWPSASEAAEAIEWLLADVDIYLPSLEDIQSLGIADTNAAALVALQRLACPLVLLKDGARGCTILAHGEQAFIPAAAVDKVVDTTGAGDSFNGAFIKALTGGASPKAAAQFAAQIAAKQLTVKGGVMPKDMV